jgi:hypothetical protein
MSIGKTTFGLNKGEYSDKITRIIDNHRTNSRLIGVPKDFVLRSCRLTEQWMKLSNESDVEVYIRSIDIAGGRKIKMISLERGTTKQPVGKLKLIDMLYPPKKIGTAPSPEEKHYNAVRASMRLAVNDQLKAYRSSVSLPITCMITGITIRNGVKTDVDHVLLSFSEIADSFMASRGLVYADIPLVGPPTAKKFKDQQLWKDWQEFHRGAARYALVLASANRSKGCGNYTTPGHLYGSFSKQGPEDLALDF